jgi:hypothetical protein
MNINSYLKILYLGLIFFITNISATEIQSEQITVPLADSDEQGLLIINHHKGSIKITGYEGSVVIINAKLRYAEASVTKDGMKRISSNLIQLAATEKNREVTVSTNSQFKTIDLDIQIPFNFSLKLQKYDYGKISVHDLHGEMEISNINGDIVLTNIIGSAILNTVDGDILVKLKEAAKNTPMAFSTIEGNIDLTLPNDIKTRIKMKTDQGDIFTDFDIEIKEREKITETSAEDRRYKIMLEDWTYGKINGGGPEYLLKTFRGDIYLRKRKLTKSK